MCCEYICRECGQTFSKKVLVSDNDACPICESVNLEKLVDDTENCNCSPYGSAFNSSCGGSCGGGCSKSSSCDGCGH